MAAVTETSRKETVMGNKRVLSVVLGSVDNGDTWDSNLDNIDSAQFNAETNAAVGYTESGGVFTFACTGTLIVHGTVIGLE